MESLVKKIGLCVAGLLLPALACAQQRETAKNASDTEPARLLAVFVVDADETTLTTPDSR
jgi:hypothetical protein